MTQMAGQQFLLYNKTGKSLTYLLPGYDHVVLDISKDRRLDEVSSVCSYPTPTHQLGSLSLPTADVTQNLVKLLLVHLDNRTQNQKLMFSYYWLYVHTVKSLLLQFHEQQRSR